MDIKEKISEIVNKISTDKKLQEQFQKEPIKAVESLLGVDLPDEIIEKVVEGVKAKINLNTLGGVADKIKGLF